MSLPLPHCLSLGQCVESRWIFSHLSSRTVHRQEIRKIDFLYMCMDVAIFTHTWKDVFESVVGLSTIFYLMDLLVALTVKNLPAIQETQVWSLGQEYPLEKQMGLSTIFYLILSLAWCICIRHQAILPIGRNNCSAKDNILPASARQLLNDSVSFLILSRVTWPTMMPLRPRLNKLDNTTFDVQPLSLKPYLFCIFLYIYSHQLNLGILISVFF